MLPATVRILLCTKPQDMRRSFDTLAQLVREQLGEEPQSGALFIFVGKRPTRIKVLWWDKNGYCLLSKRFHQAVVKFPSLAEQKSNALHIDAAAFAKLLAGVACEKKRNQRLTAVLH